PRRASRSASASRAWLRRSESSTPPPGRSARRIVVTWSSIMGSIPPPATERPRAAAGLLVPRGLGQGLNPDVAEAHLAAVVLQQDRPGGAELLVDGGAADVVELAVVNNRDAVEDDGDAALLSHLALVIDARGVQGKVVGVPLLRRLDGLLLGVLVRG